MSSPSRKRREGPKKRLNRPHRNSGTVIPHRACRVATRKVTSCINHAKERPPADRYPSTTGASSPPATPTRIGVPTAPKETGVLWMMRPTITAAAAGKPRAINRGAVTAAGVPKPDAPSMKLPNSHPTTIAWMRRSRLRPVSESRIVRTAPLRVMVDRRRRAPKTM